ASDVVSLHVPLNSSTRHMIGEGELALMKPSAILVNTCRGPVIDEAALHRTLSAGKLFGAGLDVFDREPPPPDNPLFKLDNVVLTAHFAGPTWDKHLPLDLIEALTYGREWQLGYDKLPPLPWWVVEIVHRLFGSDVAYYALSEFVILATFALVFATARPLVGAAGALVAVLIIDGL